MAAVPFICLRGTSSLSRFCVSVGQTLQSRSPFTRALMGLNKSAVRFDSERLQDDSSHSRLCVAACRCMASTHTHTHTSKEIAVCSTFSPLCFLVSCERTPQPRFATESHHATACFLHGSSAAWPPPCLFPSASDPTWTSDESVRTQFHLSGFLNCVPPVWKYATNPADWP